MNKQLLHTLLLLMSLALPLKTVAEHAPNAKKFTVVIDAGHGGHDPGAIGKFSKEKNINLSIALEVGRLIEKNCSDVKVVYTRKTDVFVELDGRARIANKAKADLFISVHTNALPNGRIARGVETYTLGMHRAQSNLNVAKRENAVILVEKNYQERYAGFNPNSSESYIIFEFMQDKYMAQSVTMAKFVQKNVVTTAARPDKGVHQAGFLVLRNTSMPSVLIEVGYISTPDEEQYLNSSTGVANLGRSIYKAFLQYKAQRNGKNKASSQTLSESLKEQDAEAQTVLPIKTSNEQPETKAEAAKSSNITQISPAAKTDDRSLTEGSLMFKVQFYSSPTEVKDRSVFKGITPINMYKENGRYKYICYETKDYDEAMEQRQKTAEKFSDAFIVAFKGDKRTDIYEAIREYRRSQKK